LIPAGLLAIWLVASSGPVAAQEPDPPPEAPPPEEPAQSEEMATQIDLSGLFYLTYESGELSGEKFGDFFVNRAYITAEADILPFLSGRVTLDTAQDLEGQGRGDMEVRLKYAFAKFHFGDWGLFRDPNLEAGIVHMVWLDFEEHVNRYRMRGPMFMERSGIFNSADFGVTLASTLGQSFGDEYRERVNEKYDGRLGSSAVGLYNGGGYHADERNTEKVLEARLTLRPLPDTLRGLQLSGLAIIGRGNLAAEPGLIPDWRTYNAFVSYEHPHGAATAQYVWGRGNQRGTWTEPDDPSQATDFSGYSFFAEARLGAHWRIIGTYDRFERRPGNADESFERVFAAVGYDLGKQNILMLDWDRRWFDDL